MDVEKVFENVTGRKMGPDEVTRYLKFQKEFEVPDTDPTWMIFVWFEFYQRIFEQLPEKARKEAEEVARSLRDASVEVTKATRDEVKASRDAAKIEIGKMQVETVKNIADALGLTLTTEIGKAVGQLQSQSNRPLHKKWFIALSVAAILFLGAGAWGSSAIHKKWVAEGVARGIDYGIDVADPTAKSFRDLIDCTGPGWKVQWSNDGKKAWCYPYPDPKTGKPYGWRIR
jgi:hypothetical protein